MPKPARVPRPFVLPATVVVATLLAACQPVAGDFPSLQPRAIERLDDSVAARPAPPPTTDAATLGRIARHLADGERAVAQFAGIEGEVSREVARAGGVGSDSWVAAQLAITRLDAARSEASMAVTALDELFAAELAAGRAPPAAAQAQHDRLADAAARQAAAIEAIKGRLAAP